MAILKQQHYLPQFYLRFFQAPAKPGYIFFYRREEIAVMANIRKVARQSYLYAYEDEDGKRRFEIEEFLGTVESAASPILERFNTSKGPLSITAEERETLSLFVAFQVIRTPAYMNSLRGGNADFMEVVTKMHAQNKDLIEHSIQEAVAAGVDVGQDLDTEKLREFALSDEYTIEAEHGPYFLGQAIKTIEAIYPCILPKELTLLRSSSTSFITSDHPVVLLPDSEAPPLFRGGFLNSDLFLPIGNYTALYFRTVAKPHSAEHSSTGLAVPVLPVSPFRTRKLNKMTLGHAENYLYASEENSAIQKLFDKTSPPTRIHVEHPFLKKARNT
jgi:hypothetical protein